jgi:hypothetical protein
MSTAQMMLSGAAGIILAALVYYAISDSGGILLPYFGKTAEAIVFLLLFAFSLLELPLMAFGLRTMQKTFAVNRAIASVSFGAYVGFAGIYAGIQAGLFGATFFSHALVATSLLRWLTGFWIIGRGAVASGASSR